MSGLKKRIQSVLVFTFTGVAFVLLFFSPFGPLNSSVIPFHPIGWAGIFVYLAMIVSYSQKYENTRNIFWYILALVFFPLLISDLYFFPIPKLLGFGMLEWAGVQSVVSFVCFLFFSKVKLLRSVNLLMLMLFPFVVAGFLLPEFEVFWVFRVVPLLYLVVIAVSLSYYSFLQREYLLIVGIFLNFIVANVIATLYVSYGILLFGWSQAFMAVITDRIAIFGRILMVLNLPTKRT